MRRTERKNNHKSKVLFVIPTLGQRTDLLQQTLASLASQRPFPPTIILVCPKPTGLSDMADRYGAIVTKDTGGGISSALNIGFKLAKPWHEYGGWMGDDDLLREGSIAKTVNALDNNPNAVLAFGGCDYIDDKGRTLFTSRAGRLAPWLMRWGPNLVPLPGIIYRLSAAKKVGEYDKRLKYAMDLDMWLRLRTRGSFINTHETIGAFRWHPTSTTVENRELSLREAETVKRRYLSRPFRLMSPLWEAPVRFATRMAVRKVNKLARV